MEELKRYHPSLNEQAILKSNLKRYFSYPDRSPDRSRIAEEVTKELQKYSDRWTIRAVRLWFNNNRKNLLTDLQDKSHEKKNISIDISNKNVHMSLPNPLVLQKCKTSINVKQLDLFIPNQETPEQIVREQSLDAAYLCKLEDEAAWLTNDSQRLKEIIKEYNNICINKTNPELKIQLKSANFIEFPLQKIPSFPITIKDLLNGSIDEKEVEQKCWSASKSKFIDLPPFSCTCIMNSYAAYVYEKDSKQILEYIEHPEYSATVQSFNVPFKSRADVVQISSDFALVISGNVICQFSKNLPPRTLILSAGHVQNPVMSLKNGKTIIASPKSDILYYLTPNFKVKSFRLSGGSCENSADFVDTLYENPKSGSSLPTLSDSYNSLANTPGSGSEITPDDISTSDDSKPLEKPIETVEVPQISELFGLPTKNDGITSLETLDEKFIAAFSRNTVPALFDINGKEIRTFIGHRACPTRISAFSESIFATAADDCTIKLWDVREMRATMTISSPGTVPSTIHATKHTVVGGYDDLRVRAIDIRHKRAKPLIGFEVGASVSELQYNPVLDSLCLFTKKGSAGWADSPDAQYRLETFTPVRK